MISDAFRSLTFTQALYISGGLAFLFTSLIGSLMLRRRSRIKRRKKPSARPVVATKTLKRAYSGSKTGEFHGLVESLSAKIDCLDTAIARCMDLSRELSNSGIINSDEGFIVHSPQPGALEIEGRIEEMRSSGIDESDIAKRLNLSAEQFKLYMHVGHNKEKAVSLH